MSDAGSTGFGKLVPGFDFLQSLVKGASSSIPKIPSLASWVAPTLNVEDLTKRIDELKAVQFWLDQNAVALKATIQALEVQKLTVATLESMNVSIGDMASAFKFKATESVASGISSVTETAASAAKTLTDAVSSRGASDKATNEPVAEAVADDKAGSGLAGLVVDPMQLWGSLTLQFQQIAAAAMKEATKATAVDATRNMAAGLAKETIKATQNAVSSATASVANAIKPKKAPAKPIATAKPLAKTGAPAKKATRAR